MDDRWVDVNFPAEPQYVPGVIADEGELYASLAPYSSVASVLTEGEIREQIEQIDDAGGGADQLVSRIYNQGREGSCVANACCQAHEVVQARQHGKSRVVHLSAISLYKRIGRSPSSGAVVSHGVEELATRGALPLDTAENRERFRAVMPNTGFYEKFPANWESTAAEFRSDEWYSIKSVNELMTALCRQEPVIVGREGHSICYVRPMYEGRSFRAKYANSWGNWGDNGYGYDTARQIEKSARWAAALRSVRSAG